jgi:hypothetical protein
MRSQSDKVYFELAENIWIDGPMIQSPHPSANKITPSIVRRHITNENLHADDCLLLGYMFGLITIGAMTLMAIYCAVVYSSYIWIMVIAGLTMFVVVSMIAICSARVRDHQHFKIRRNIINGGCNYIVTPRAFEETTYTHAEMQTISLINNH